MIGLMAKEFIPACCTSQDCYCQFPLTRGRPQSTHASAGVFQTLTDESGSVSYGVPAPFFWVWCTHVCVCVCVCALQEFLFPQSCGNSVIKSCWTSNQIPWRSSVLLSDPQLVKPVAGPRTFTTVWELLWYNCSLVCGLSTGQPYSDYRLTTKCFFLFVCFCFFYCCFIKL